MNYAQIDEQCYCIGLHTLTGEITNNGMILLKDTDVVKFGQKYDIINKVWLDEFKPQETQEPIITDIELLQQQLTDIELQNLEAQSERQLLAQQISDLEIVILGGGK